MFYDINAFIIVTFVTFAFVVENTFCFSWNTVLHFLIKIFGKLSD